MVDIEPPPVPTRATTLRRPPPRIFFRRIGQLLLLLGASAVFAVLATHFVPAIGVYVAALVVVVVVLLAVPYKLIAVLRDRVGTCPFCAAMLGTGNEAALRYRAKPELVRCDACSEHSMLERGVLRPHNPTVVTRERIFRSPLFKNAVWPRGCAACGEPPTRFITPPGTDMSAAAPLAGALGYSPGEIGGVPHCGAHDAGVSLHVENKRLCLMWSSLPQMRRYLAANRKKNLTQAT